MKSTFSKKYRTLLANALANPVLWVGFAVTVLVFDWLADPAISFPFAFIIPVALASWHRGLRWGAFFAVGLPLVRFGFNCFRDTSWSDLVSAVNLGIRIVVLYGFAWLIALSVKQRRHIDSLERLLPICAWCGKIRDDNKSAWERLDTYLATRTDISFTHTICQECTAKQMPQKSVKGS